MTVRKVSKSKPPPSCACSPSRENGRVMFSQGFGGSSAAFAAAGVDYATEQCAGLLDHDVAGLHFYTLNKSGATLEIAGRLGLTGN